jgi:hypothetical protein
MKNLKQTLKIAFAVIAIIALPSCSSQSKSWVKNLENCLGTVKTEKDAQNLSNEQVVTMSKCLLEHLDDMRQKLAKMDEKEKEKIEKEFAAEVEKSEYKEIMHSLDYEKVKRMAGAGATNNLLQTNSNPTSSSTQSSPDDAAPSVGDAPPAPPAPMAPPVEMDASSNDAYDEMLNAYDRNADDYISLANSMDKAEIGNSMGNYASLVQSTMELEKKMKAAKSSGKMTSDQLVRFIQIQAKTAKAAQKISAKYSNQ